MNKLFKKGLVSLAAASVLATGAMAATTTIKPTVIKHWSGSEDNNVTIKVGDINITENLVSSLVYAESLTITIPNNVKVKSIYDDLNGTLEYNASATEAGIYIHINNSGTNYVKLFDLNNSDDDVTTTFGKAVFAYDTNDTNTAVLLLDKDGKTIDDNATDIVLGTTTINGNGLTLKINVKDQNDSRKNTIQLHGLKLKPASTSTTGDVVIGIGTDGGQITPDGVTVANLVSSPIYLKLQGSVDNIAKDEATDFADFNITKYDNVPGLTGKIKFKVVNGKINSINVYNGTGFYEGNVSTEDNITFTLNLNNSAETINIADINITGTVTASALGDVKIELVSGDGNFSTVSSDPIIIAKAVADGVEIIPKDGNDTAYTEKFVYNGKTGDLVDFNISENFKTSFKAGKEVVVSLPSGYKFTEYPNVGGDVNASRGGGFTYANPAVIMADDNGSFSFKFTSTQFTPGFLEENATQVQDINISNLKVSVPADASGGDVVTLTITSPVDGQGTLTLNAATVKESKVDVNADNNISSSELRVAMENSTPATGAHVDINESTAGLIDAPDKTITVTLSDGTFADYTDDLITLDDNTPTTLFVDLKGTLSDDKKTITFVTQSKTSSTEANFEIVLPGIDVSKVAEAKVIKAIVDGTAGVAGEVEVAQTYDPANKVEVTGELKAVAIGDSGQISTIKISEVNEENGIHGGNKFKIIAPAGINFDASNEDPSGLTVKVNGETRDVDASRDSVNSFNDTLIITLPSLEDNEIDSIEVTATINVVADTEEGIAEFTVKDVNGSGIPETTGLKALYKGTIPALAPDNDTVDVEIDGSATVTLSGVVGTVSATDDNDNITVTVDGNTATIKADANATEGDTATVTFTDSLTDKTATVTVSVKAPAPAEVDPKAEVEDAVVAAGEMPISGYYAAYDFDGDGTPGNSYNDWAYTTAVGSNTFQLLGEPSGQGYGKTAFGWKDVTSQVTVENKDFAMVQYGTGAFDWLVFTPDCSKVYKLVGATAEGKFNYDINNDGSVTTDDALNLTCTVNNGSVTFTQK